MSSRRKNPHPKRAVNARTVLVVAREEPLVLCLKIPDEDDDFEGNHQIQKEEEEEEDEDEDVERLRRILSVPCVAEQNQMREEETAFIAKGVKRKRGHECWVCEKVFRYPSLLVSHMRIHTKEKP
jgi:hypothetical protein